MLRKLPPGLHMTLKRNVVFDRQMESVPAKMLIYHKTNIKKSTVEARSLIVLVLLMQV